MLEIKVPEGRLGQCLFSCFQEGNLTGIDQEFPKKKLSFTFQANLFF